MEQPEEDDNTLWYAAGVRELRDHLSQYLAEVRAGKSVVVLDHGHPVAVLKPWPHRDPLEELIRQGRVRRPQTYARRRHEPDVEFRGTDQDLDNLLRTGD